MTFKTNRELLVLVDAFSLIFQVFHAIRGMTSPSGLPTNALFGFTRDMLYLHEDLQPDYLVCVFDGQKPTFRSEIFEQYKANRSEMPEDLRLQIEPIFELLAAMNIPVLVVEGFEADDVIATLARLGEERGMDVLICSSDKDCRQLISERVKIFNLRKQSVIDEQALLDDWGVKPEQVIDLQSLVGDPVDNVPGVPGIGLKTAAKLLQEYGTVENLLANVDAIPGAKRRDTLKASAELIARSRKLVALDTHVPIEPDWEALRRRPMNAPALLKLFRQWGFHRFADQVQEIALETPSAPSPQKNGPAKPRRNKNNSEYDLFSAQQTNGEDLQPSNTTTVVAQPRKASWDAHYQLVTTSKQLKNVIALLKKCGRFAIDLETTGIDPLRSEIVGYAVCMEPGEAYYIAVRTPPGCTELDPQETLELLRPVLEDEKIAKVNQNIKFDQLCLRHKGVNLAGVAGDSMIADYLLNTAERDHSLDNLARAYLEHEMIPITELIGKKGPKQLTMEQVAPDRIAEYAGEDADAALRLCNLLEKKLEEEGLRQLYDEVEIPLIDVLVELQYNGIRLDVQKLAELGESLGRQIADLEKEIHDLAGEPFNVASLKQLRTVLFDKLKLPIRKKTGITGEPSTDQESLEWLAAQGHALPKALLTHRQLSKLKGTYIDALPALVNPSTKRLHTSFHQTVAATGRLSSSDPNLQNIPIRSDVGGQIRQAFVPAEGWVMLTADYSQVELRLLAHFSEDDELLRAFAEDRDIHSMVAAKIAGVPEEEVTPAMRRAAKTVNFGVIYGMSAYGLSQRLQIPKEESAKFIDTYFAQYPRVLEYQDNLLKKCREQGYVSTILGRRRPFQENVIRPDSTYQQRNQAEREAINMEIQGSAADLIKIAMLQLHRRAKKEKWQTRMLLQIHDELVFESPPEEVEPVGKAIVQEMSNALSDRLKVKLKVDLAAGANWLDAEPLNL